MCVVNDVSARSTTRLKMDFSFQPVKPEIVIIRWNSFFQSVEELRFHRSIELRKLLHDKDDSSVRSKTRLKIKILYKWKELFRSNQQEQKSWSKVMRSARKVSTGMV